VRNLYITISGKSKGGDYSEDLDVDGRIIVEWIIEKYDRNL
jgi:hypothetical protein